MRLVHLCAKGRDEGAVVNEGLVTNRTVVCGGSAQKALGGMGEAARWTRATGARRRGGAACAYVTDGTLEERDTVVAGVVGKLAAA